MEDTNPEYKCLLEMLQMLRWVNIWQGGFSKLIRDLFLDPSFLGISAQIFKYFIKVVFWTWGGFKLYTQRIQKCYIFEKVLKKRGLLSLQIFWKSKFFYDCFLLFLALKKKKKSKKIFLLILNFREFKKFLILIQK